MKVAETIEIKGTRIYCKIMGKGEPLVLLHGNLGSHRYFSRQIRLLSAYFKVIAPDTRGHGASGFGHRPLNIKVLAEELAELLEKLEIKRCHLLGFSDGANIALQYATRHGESLSSLILIGANLEPEGLRRLVLSTFRISRRITGFLGRIIPPAARLSKILGLAAGDPRIDVSLITQIQVPTLILAGRKDVIKRTHTQEIADLISGSQLHTIPGGRHHLLRQKPEICNRIILDFLQENKLDK